MDKIPEKPLAKPPIAPINKQQTDSSDSLRLKDTMAGKEETPDKKIKGVETVDAMGKPSKKIR